MCELQKLREAGTPMPWEGKVTQINKRLGLAGEPTGRNRWLVTSPGATPIPLPEDSWRSVGILARHVEAGCLPRAGSLQCTRAIRAAICSQDTSYTLRCARLYLIHDGQCFSTRWSYRTKRVTGCPMSAYGRELPSR